MDLCSVFIGLNYSLIKHTGPNSVVQRLSMKGCGSVDCLLQTDFQVLGDFLIQKGHGWAGRGSLHRYLEALMA